MAVQGIKISATAAVTTVVLFFGFDSAAVAAGNLPSLVNDVTTSVRSVVKPATAPLLTPPLESAPVPNSGVNVPRTPPPVDLPSTGGSSPATPTNLPAAAGTPDAALDVIGGGGGTDPSSPDGDTDSTRHLAGEATGASAAPPPETIGSHGSRKRGLVTNTDRARGPVWDLRIAPIRSWLLRIWPAVALGQDPVGTLLNLWKSEGSRLILSDLVGSFVEKAPGEATTVGAVEGDLAAAASNPPSSPLSHWLPSDPPLPVAVFWILMAVGLAFVSFIVRRELGLAGGQRRRRI